MTFGPEVDDLFPEGLIGFTGLPDGVAGEGRGGELAGSGGDGADGSTGVPPLEELVGGGEGGEGMVGGCSVGGGINGVAGGV